MLSLLHLGVGVESPGGKAELSHLHGHTVVKVLCQQAESADRQTFPLILPSSTLHDGFERTARTLRIDAARVSASARVATRDPLARAPAQKCVQAARHPSRARNPELN